MARRHHAQGRRKPGGTVGLDELEALSAAAVNGIDPVWLMTCDDPFAVQAAVRVAFRVATLKQRRDDNQAVKHANAIGKMLSG